MYIYYKCIGYRVQRQNMTNFKMQTKFNYSTVSAVGLTGDLLNYGLVMASDPQL